MKTFFALAAATLISGSQICHASTISTSSDAVNAKFPKTAEQIKKIDSDCLKAVAAMGGGRNDKMGLLLSYKCDADIDDKYPASIGLSCVFNHDLPKDWDWFGSYEVTYKADAGEEGATSVSVRWVR